MTLHEMRYFFGQRRVRRTVRMGAGLLGIVARGYAANTFVEHAMPSLGMSSGFTLASKAANPEAPAAMADTKATTGVASASVPVPPALPTPEVGYFPIPYLKQATTTEEPSPTF